MIKPYVTRPTTRVNLPKRGCEGRLAAFTVGMAVAGAVELFPPELAVVIVSLPLAVEPELAFTFSLTLALALTGAGVVMALETCVCPAAGICVWVCVWVCEGEGEGEAVLGKALAGASTGVRMTLGMAMVVSTSIWASATPNRET